MTERIARIKDEILSTRPSICIERARIYTRLYKENENLPVVEAPRAGPPAHPRGDDHLDRQG